MLEVIKCRFQDIEPDQESKKAENFEFGH
jgi:hypothetical protein